MQHFKEWLDDNAITIVQEGIIPGPMLKLKLQFRDGRQPYFAFAPEALEEAPERAVEMVEVLLNDPDAPRRL